MDYIATYGMGPNEIREWEKKNEALAMECDNGIMELFPTCLRSIDYEELSMPESVTNTLQVSVCDIDEADEICLYFGKNDLRRLRDYLNDYLEGRVKHNYR